ncbi:hypothetical protein CRG98_013521 [Punica granatum]|uniref:Uncharacterized protein n=1 Tax=Punica granatum TaxID=22663 RepID=A0A2I0KDA9_PUNGR|nr:hypothetical protein CRG98_013521 [Punica granatum]
MVKNSPGTKLKQLEKFLGVVGNFWKIQGLIEKCWAGLLGTGWASMHLFWPLTGDACATRKKKLTRLAKSETQREKGGPRAAGDESRRLPTPREGATSELWENPSQERECWEL